MTTSEIKIYKSEDGSSEIQVKLDNETVRLSQKQMAELFGKDSDTIGLHLKSIFKSEELDEFSTTEFYSVVQQEGKRIVKRKIKVYNLDAIISVGYRVNLKRGTQFRIWANKNSEGLSGQRIFDKTSRRLLYEVKILNHENQFHHQYQPTWLYVAGDQSIFVLRASSRRFS